MPPCEYNSHHVAPWSSLLQTRSASQLRACGAGTPPGRFTCKGCQASARLHAKSAWLHVVVCGDQGLGRRFSACLRVRFASLASSRDGQSQPSQYPVHDPRVIHVTYCRYIALRALSGSCLHNPSQHYCRTPHGLFRRASQQNKNIHRGSQIPSVRR